MLPNRSRFEYTTPHFNCKAKVCSITASSANTWLGFVQTCTALDQRHLYDDGAGNEIENGYKCSPSLPLSDSSSTAAQPWYFVGAGFACRDPTAGATIPKAVDHIYHRELDDNFQDNALDLRAQTGANMAVGSSLKKVIRTQDFSLWLVAYSNHAFRLLMKCNYQFSFALNVKGVSVTPLSGNTVSAPLPCKRTDKLPAEALGGSLCNAASQFYAA